MRTLKELTPNECVTIATIAEPNVEWKFVQSRSQWDGFDMIEKDCTDESLAKHFFQIDCRDKKERNGKAKFRIYNELNEYNILNLSDVLTYLNSIGMKEIDL